MPISKTKTIVIGIDPGTKRIGFGVIEIISKRIEFVDAGLLKPKTEGFTEPARELCLLIKKYRPSILCIEKVYFSKNVRSAISVSEIKGALTLEAEKQNLKIVEISPTEAKSALTGYGQADKTSVRKMVFRLLGEQRDLKSKDAIDALAIAIAGEMKNRTEELIRS
ncbi:MAG: hypothetical protein A2418_03380 [Candidatus Brennerbacteria bacterium RIFOXYC1_FULL_41_11]|uniref:Uncharacterized protein n=1 Tax=Candidatus Brennerbacteria bacterium RIFOXYD1_FULL_41_16 TaxID=1797529 RepID=A0A1G1XM50_9BACT|nr:MAG: hypothetical protein A2391_01060 [Candidatus Brennerbacteria bacterium RIFOXYB1_FULL_41_13]OGY40116.1 MAG: hypothetical protein A2418_03380 [Candidatus Brennerbacteria bacterium RIFOXYC1_FULL_41_11]OGY40680.1 MAG: hypothetical protein A2570_00925 [Candidatus Brennerbacteria bacterium RIFOXYD1_FULL_41_16]